MLFLEQKRWKTFDYAGGGGGGGCLRLEQLRLNEDKFVFHLGLGGTGGLGGATLGGTGGGVLMTSSVSLSLWSSLTICCSF